MNKIVDIEVFILSSDGIFVKRDLIRNRPYRIEVDKLKTGIYFIEYIKKVEKSRRELVKL